MNFDIIKQELKEELKSSLIESIQRAAKELETNSEFHNEMVLYINRYNQIEKESRLGIISDESKELSLNRLRFAYLKSIDSLGIEDRNKHVNQDLKQSLLDLTELTIIESYFNFETDWLLGGDEEGPIKSKIIRKKSKVITNQDMIRLIFDEIIIDSYDYPENWKREEPDQYIPIEGITHDFNEIEFSVHQIKELSIIEIDEFNKFSPKLVKLKISSFEAGQILVKVSNLMKRNNYLNDLNRRIVKIEYEEDEGFKTVTNTHDYEMLIPEKDVNIIIEKMQKFLK